MTALTKSLKEEARLQEKAQEAKESLESELTTFRGQMEKAKADALVLMGSACGADEACVC